MFKAHEDGSTHKDTSTHVVLYLELYREHIIVCQSFM